MQEIDEQELLKCISILQRKTQIFLNSLLDDLGITGGQAPFLVAVCQRGGMAQNHLCEVMDMSRGTVAKMLAKLEEEGYVKRCCNPDDARAVDVYPTERAQALYSQLCRHGEECVRTMTDGMSDVERMAFYELMRKACRNMTNSR
ncbi:MAG: MarR family winged helix-turn-helix transcriptional regulator [Butyricicoccus sp.]|nr:MarR family winged helix-turn-helix transcriptional regulator [Butyricicoccus sp.]